MSENTAQQRSFRATLAPLVSQVCNKLGVMHLLDFHCGNDPIMNYLRVNHKMKIMCYDPKVERFSEPPLACELVFFESNALTKELIDEAELLTGVVCIIASETDDPDQWILPLVEKFEMQTFQRVDGGFYAILYCRPNVALYTGH